MICECDLQLHKCMWPGQCDNDINRHNGECMNKQRIENSEYAEIVALDPKYEWKKDKETNQQATANHTAKMFNQSKLRKVIAGLSDYDPELYNQSRIQWLASDGNPANKPKEMKMTRKEAKHKLQMVGSLEADKALDMLEALGLIKFEEEKSVVDEAKKYVRNYTLYDRQELAGVIDMLIRHIEK